MTEQERFWQKVQSTSAQGRWIWTAGKDKGYGAFSVKRNGKFRMKAAHILSYEYVIGQIPEGKDLHHTCGTRACVNWLHLEPIAKAMHGLISSRNTYKTHCPSGHPYTEENTWRNKRGHRYCRKCIFNSNEHRRMERAR